MTVEDMPIKNDSCNYPTNLAEKKQVGQDNADVFCLDADYSTTRLATRQIPVIDNKPGDAFTSTLFLPEGEERKGEGGLRTKGIFKKSFPDKPLITVVTVVFNGEKHLEDTILSVINQTYENVEYIVIDGGSKDGTLEIIKKYTDQIDYWVSEPDRGIYDAMNKGICLTQGNYVNFMNAGDLFVNTYNVKNVVRYTSCEKNIIYSDVFLRSEGQKGLKLFQCDHKRMTFVHQSMFYRKQLHHDCGLYLVRCNISISDYLFFNLVEKKYFYKINSPISINLIGGVSYNYGHIRQKFAIDYLLGEVNLLQLFLKVVYFTVKRLVFKK